jgi:hypothetical protein
MLGGTATSLPVDPEDVVWFGRTLQEKGIDVRAQISRSVAAARDLGVLVFMMNLLAEQLPKEVAVQATVQGERDHSCDSRPAFC